MSFRDEQKNVNCPREGDLARFGKKTMRTCTFSTSRNIIDFSTITCRCRSGKAGTTTWGNVFYQLYGKNISKGKLEIRPGCFESKPGVSVHGRLQKKEEVLVSHWEKQRIIWWEISVD